MNTFYRKICIVTVFLCCLISGFTYADYHHIAFTHNFIKSDNTAINEYRSNHDFSHGRKYDFPIFLAHQAHFNNYTEHDFRDHFFARGYTESEILNQHCLYMLDGFVKYAQTYPGYKNKIQQLYAQLKNLNLIQKTYYTVKGTYCRGLQKRIRSLYNALDSIKTNSQYNNFSYLPDQTSSCTNVTNFDRAAIAQQFTEYETLEYVYDAYAPALSNAINARLETYNLSLDDSTLVDVGKSYTLNNNINQLLLKYGHGETRFTHCFGSQLQQVIHQESLDILNHIDTLPYGSVLYAHQEALIDFTVAMVDYNHAGLTDKAMSIGDLCWALLDYGQAIAEGVALGMYSAAHDILTSPIEATISIIAGKQVLAFQLCKVFYNVADIGATAIYDTKNAQEKWDKYTEPLNRIMDAINKKEITVRDAIKGSTAFVVGYKAQGKLLGGLGKFCNSIKQKSINFVKSSPLLNPQEYLTTPEGLLFKATTKSNKGKLADQNSTVSYLKETIKNKISKQKALSAIPIAGQGVIRKGDLRVTIQKYRDHIFSEKHEQKGLMAVGENQEAIMDSLYETLSSLDKKGCLREGNNQLRIMINGIDNIEVRCFIQKGEVISINAFISTFGRIFSNFIDARKV